MKIRAIVVDQFPLMCAAVAAALGEDPGFAVVATAGDGASALELATRLAPDVLVLDLNLPALASIAVLERIRAELPAVRTLVLSATQSAERIREAFAAGAAGCLCKSASAEEIRQAVITVHGGGSVINPEMAAYVLRAYSDGIHGDRWGHSALSERELRIIRLVAQGHTDSEIADALFLCRRTIQNHLASIRDKTGLRRRVELARWASEHA
jgi:DNA-binding NarL/FixJ family response regulator